MGTEDLNLAVQELMARMKSIQAELTDLKTRAKVSPQPDVIKPLHGAITTTRRKTIRRLGLALLGGAATAVTLGAVPPAEAKVSVHPTANGMTNRVGMLVLPPGAPSPTGTLFGSINYGLIASADKITALNTSLIFGNPTGLTGFGSGDGQSGIGIQGFGSFGVYGTGTFYGLVGYGTDSGVRASGFITGGNFRGGDSGYGVGAFASSAFLENDFPANTAVGLVASAGKRVDASNIFANNQNVGLYATADTSLGRNPTAAYFEGTVLVHGGLGVQGNLTKSSGTFKIDHPLDPENKYLYHSFVESPDMKNIYDGVITLDEKGEATVTMPDWFEALNRDYRYQLTCMGQYAPVYIAQKITGLEFKIAGGKPGQEVSWMVTGIRQDEWAKAHPIQVEEEKTGKARGKYLHPEVFGKAEALKVGLQL